jgi:hypothetical protein
MDLLVLQDSARKLYLQPGDFNHRRPNYGSGAGGGTGRSRSNKADSRQGGNKRVDSNTHTRDRSSLHYSSQEHNSPGPQTLRS